MAKYTIDTKLGEKDKVYGTTTVGERGQIVIPVEARKELDLKPGDHLIVMGKLGKALGIFKLEHLQEIISIIMNNITADEHTARDIQKQIQQLFGPFSQSKPTKHKK